MVPQVGPQKLGLPGGSSGDGGGTRRIWSREAGPFPTELGHVNGGLLGGVTAGSVVTLLATGSDAGSLALARRADPLLESG